jgi:predicted dehydrogenase
MKMEQDAAVAGPDAVPPSAPLRLGLAGCGYQGRQLASAASLSPALCIVACADPDLVAAERTTELAKDASTHSSVESLLDDPAVDAVVVATPHHLLCPVSLAVLRAGKHVLAEKPIALNAREAAELETAAARAGVRFMAGYSCRFSLARYVRDLLADGVAGELVAMTGAFYSGPFERGWAASVDSGGGPMLYLGSHLVDMLLWFAGDNPVEVSGKIRRLGNGLDDTSAFQVVFSSGAVAQCLVTQAAPSFSYRVDIQGRGGRVTLHGTDFTHFEVEVESHVSQKFSKPTVIRPPAEGDHIATMLVPELEEFASAVRENRSPAINVADGKRVLQVLDAVVAADRTGTVVQID